MGTLLKYDFGATEIAASESSITVTEDNTCIRGKQTLYVFPSFLMQIGLSVSGSVKGPDSQLALLAAFLDVCENFS